jgi:hypothetical protein
MRETSAFIPMPYKKLDDDERQKVVNEFREK